MTRCQHCGEDTPSFADRLCREPQIDPARPHAFKKTITEPRRLCGICNLASSAAVHDLDSLRASIATAKAKHAVDCPCGGYFYGDAVPPDEEPSTPTDLDTVALFEHATKSCPNVTKVDVAAVIDAISPLVRLKAQERCVCPPDAREPHRFCPVHGEDAF